MSNNFGTNESLLNFSEEEFENYRQLTMNKIKELRLPVETTPVEAKILIANMDQLYTLIRLDFIELESKKDEIENIIRQTERSKVEGRNDVDRKKYSTTYLENYPINETETVDMYDLWRTTHYRYNHIRHCLDILDKKQSRMITISGYMKIDASFSR